MQLIINAPMEPCYRYLADPRRRPEWQSSLRRVEAPDVEPHLGLVWRDITVIGIKPELEITRMEPFWLWQETGTWRGVCAVLTLQFIAVAAGTRVLADVEVSGGLAARTARFLAPAAISADLRTAARRIEQRG